MRYHALAADYDGTLAHHGEIDEPTWAALRRLKESGRKAIMVTGRELDELLALLPHPEVFDRIVAENGALVYTPATKEVRTTCDAPPPEFVEELRKRGVDRVSAGRVIVATWEPHQDTVFHTIRDMELELQVIFNKGAVMVLPTGVNKATGLTAALLELGLSAHNVVGVGDAENDHALLHKSECGAAVANALTTLKDKADLVLTKDHGTGVTELIDHLVTDDLAIAAPRLTRHHILLGTRADRPVSIDPYGTNIMICGTSGSGKSTLTTGILERLHEHDYQFAIIDPEGDYSNLEFAMVLGSAHRAPLVEEVVDVLKDPSRSVVINLLGIAVEHRPDFAAELLPALTEVRSRTGRPHWLVIDEAHHLLPAGWDKAAEMPLRPHGTIYVTVHPGSVAPELIHTIDTLIAIGEHPDERVAELCEAIGAELPAVEAIDKLPPGHALLWRTDSLETEIMVSEPPKTERLRHSRKYIEGNLGSGHSFYFRGPEGKLNLKAHNLQLFMHLAQGVDDDTWLYHLHNGEYSNWFRTEVKDAELADETEQVERDEALAAAESREAIRAAIDRRYTLPADKASGLQD